jgi:hypothetical protein
VHRVLGEVQPIDDEDNEVNSETWTEGSVLHKLYVLGLL